VAGFDAEGATIAACPAEVVLRLVDRMPRRT
jgi:hypothetical protein